MFDQSLAREMGLTREEVALFRRLKTPCDIQDFLDTLRINFEERGDTHRSPRQVLKTGEAHCIEAAVLSATALWLHGQDPLLLDLVAKRGDYGHVVALYKVNGYWGALSKSNHATIRFRDPVYKTVRELALSYYHEWFPEKTGKRTLLSYSTPLNLKRFGLGWVTSKEDLWWLDDKLDAVTHSFIAPIQNLKMSRRADHMEIKAGSLLEHTPRKPHRKAAS